MVFNRPLAYNALPSAVKGLLIANAGVFCLQWTFSVADGPSLVDTFALVPNLLVHGQGLWRPLTYLFLHGGLLHLLFNAFMLWTLGVELEHRWGARAFTGYYFLCGVGAALFHVLVDPHSLSPVVGASGAIYGLLVAFAMMYPMSVFYIYFLIPMRAWQAVALFAVLEFLIGFSSSRSVTANFAHLGGMLTGFLYLKSRTLRYDLRRWRGRAGDWVNRRAEERRGVAFHELGQEVDRILEKISRHGLDSLTPEEQRLMERYSRFKSQP